MAQHYSVKDFFRQMPNALLARLSQLSVIFTNLGTDKQCGCTEQCPCQTTSSSSIKTQT